MEVAILLQKLVINNEFVRKMYESCLSKVLIIKKSKWKYFAGNTLATKNQAVQINYVVKVKSERLYKKLKQNDLV